MKIEEPGRGHAEIADQDDSLLIVIPTRGNPFIIAFLCFWLVGWAIGFFAVLGALAASGPSDGGGLLFVLAWLAGWTAGGAFALLMVMWMALGRERIRVTPEQIRVERVIPIWTRAKLYDAGHVTNLRLTAAERSVWGMYTAMFVFFSGTPTGSIAFDYGRSTPRFGLGLEEADAAHIVSRITERFPQYA